MEGGLFIRVGERLWEEVLDIGFFYIGRNFGGEVLVEFLDD